MPRKKKTIVESLESLDKPVRLDGVGEDPIVQALLSDKFVKGTNAEAFDIAAGMQQLLRGMSVLDQKMTDQYQQLKSRMDDMDRAAEEWETNREKFIEEVLARAGSPTDKDVVAGMNEYSNALAQAKAEAISDRLTFAAKVAQMPKETITSPGEVVMVVEGGSQVAKMMPEVIRIKNLSWTLQPGVPTEVPSIVADVYRQRRKSQEEDKARRDLLARNLSSEKLAEEWAKVNAQFHSPTDTVPI
jgi:hypothetical protein